MAKAAHFKNAVRSVDRETLVIVVYLLKLAAAGNLTVADAVQVILDERGDDAAVRGATKLAEARSEDGLAG